MLHIYGLTETSPIVTLLPGEQHLLDTPRARSCGQPAVGVEVVVVDPATAPPLPTGVVGEVLSAAPTSWPATGTSPTETAAALRRRLVRSGDLGSSTTAATCSSSTGPRT